MEEYKKVIVFTGGGTAGHVTPNIALIEKFHESGWNIHYIGSRDGIEKNIISNIPFAFYYAIHCDKIRRYFSWRHFLAPYRIMLGLFQSFFILRRIRPSIIFSKGGYVSFPVCVAAKLLGISVIVHESDLSPGLANQVSFPFARLIFVSMEKTVESFKNPKNVIVSGSPVRSSFAKASKDKGLRLLDFAEEKPILLVFGGGLGSEFLNKAVHDLLPKIHKDYNIVHLTGKDKSDTSLNGQYENYRQFEYLHDEFADVLAASDFVIARAGANSIYEVMLMEKPAILVPLSLAASRGDQMQNALYFQSVGAAIVMKEEELSAEFVMIRLIFLQRHKENIIENIKKLNLKNGTEEIFRLINLVVEHG